LSIADPQFVWARLDAYEADYPWMRIGQKVTFQTVAYPGEKFAGKVVYIDPVFNSKTRTFAIGAICPDQGGRLKTGMLIRATLEAQMTADGKVVTGRTAADRAPLVIPASAPLLTGRRSVVYVAVAGKEGVFEGREVVLGPKAKNHYLVVSGLEEGERVVVNGNFKIDSAVQILARSSMMDIEGGHSATAHQLHGGSQVMHEHYRTERMHSRTRNRLESDQAHSDMRSQLEPNDASRSGRRRHERTIIQRRKPGQYGDTTRRHMPLTGQ
jgi:Cu(I)/Ag(I) efflux system membrane fusion protein